MGGRADREHVRTSTIRSARGVERALQRLADPARARALRSFFKTGPGQYGEGDRLLGLTMPQIRALALEARDLSLDEIERLLRDSEFGLRLGADEDAAPPLPVTAETEPGELILLGAHRLLCGDATSGTDMARLLDGEHAGIAFTDPPYNVGYEPEKRPLGRSRRALAQPVSGGS